MLTFEIYIDDDRYAVPTLHLVVAENRDQALAAARRMLEEGAHHLGAEVCLAGERVAGLGSWSDRRSEAG